MKKLILLLLSGLLLCSCADSSAEVAATVEVITTVEETTAVEVITTVEETTTVEITTTAEVTATVEVTTTPEVTTTAETTTAETTAVPPEVTAVIPILMFHEIAEVTGGEWSISEDGFRRRMEFLKENGFTPITFDSLISFVDGEGDLPEKPVCITFDDGYLSNYTLLLPMVTELEIPITVFVIGSTIRKDGEQSDKMNVSELAEMEASPYVALAPHTYALHIMGYGESGRLNVLPLPEEDKETYTEMFKGDCEAAEAALAEAGVENFKVFSYPGGKYHRFAEAVLKERGYRVTLTTDPVRVNRVTKGDPDSLYLLGRLNVNDATSDRLLLRYLNKS